MPIRRRLLVCAFTVFVIAPLAAHAAAPLRPRIARCTPLSLPDAQGGFGGTAAERRVGIDFGLYTLL
ncbi:MAG TPA: hypothetical protein VN923_13700, partial [Thermoanaerobaculia bacterium]|nr:hypothetical protein [Thermoanaerobaculia bacterium]